MSKFAGVMEFVSKVEVIAQLMPRYKLGHSAIGSDPYCDCIGMVIGALSLCGVTWGGTHGTNYAVRNKVNDFRVIRSESELAVGDVLFKGYAPNDAGYNLPNAYKNDADQTDYYHVGVVTSVTPLTITHMTTPSIRKDTKLGKWRYVAKLKQVNYDTGKDGGQMAIEKEVTINGGDVNYPIKVRSTPSTGGSVIVRIPQGTNATLIEKGNEWSRIRIDNNTGYVKNDFVHDVNEQSDDVISVKIEKINAIISELQKIIGGAV